jgi:hypothetical protein
MIIKQIGLGFKGYLNDGFNIFDMIIVILSTVDVLILFSVATEGKALVHGEFNAGAIVQVFRMFRILRVFKLAKSWPSLNYVLTTMANALTKIGPFALMLILFMFIFTILGMEMFSNRLRFDRDNATVPFFGTPNENTSSVFGYPDSNFDNL